MQVQSRAALWIAARTSEVVLLALVLAFSFFIKGFADFGNLRNLLIQAAPLILLAAGQSVVLIVGGLDLSQGSVVGMASVVLFACVNWVGLPAALVITALLCLLIGIVNAYGTVKLGSAFVASFAAMYILSGLTIYKTGGTPISDIPAPALSVFVWIGTASFCGLPIVLIIAALALGLLALFLRFTTLGLHVYAFGCNPKAARMHGVSEIAVWSAAYCISSLFSGLSAVLLSARVLQGNPQMGEGLLFESIAACVVGGIALSGGIGGVWFVLRGVAMITVIQNGLYLSDMNSHIRDIAVGLMLAIGVYTSRLRLPSWGRRGAAPSGNGLVDKPDEAEVLKM